MAIKYESVPEAPVSFQAAAARKVQDEGGQIDNGELRPARRSQHHSRALDQQS